MATLAEMMAGAALESSDPTKFNNTTQAFASGAQIAQKAEELQQSKMQIEQKKQDLQSAKYEKFVEAMQKGNTLKGQARSNYYNKVLPKYRDSMGLTEDFPDESLQFNTSTPEMYARTETLINQTMQGKVSPEEAIQKFNDPVYMVGVNPTYEETEAFYENVRDAEKTRLQTQAQMVRSGSYSDRVDISRDDQTVKAIKNINEDPKIIQFTNQINAIDRGLHFITDPKKPPNFTMLAEVEQDFAGALAAAKVSSDFKLKSISQETMAKKFGELRTWITSNPNQPVPPELTKFYQDMGERLNKSYAVQLSARAKQLTKDNKLAYSKNPNAIEASDSTAASYMDGTWKGEAGAGAAPPIKLMTASGKTVNFTPEEALQFFTKYPNHAALTPELAKQLGIKKGK